MNSEYFKDPSAPGSERGSRNWCLTHFPENEGDLDQFCDTIANMVGTKEYNGTKLPFDLQYFCCGYETCPTTGRLHGQCYFQFKNYVKLATLQNNIPSRCNWLMCKGTPVQNVLYCQKKDKRSVAAGIEPNEIFKEFGTSPLRKLEGIKYLLDCTMQIFDEHYESHDEDIYEALLNLDQAKHDIDDYLMDFTQCSFIETPPRTPVPSSPSCSPVFKKSKTFK